MRSEYLFFRENSDIIPTEAFVVMVISSNYFNILFLFSTTANCQNIPYRTIESSSPLDSAELQCQLSNLMCLLASIITDVNVIQLAYTEKTLGWNFL